MPTVFGILNANQEQPDPEVISRMERAAKYLKQRRLERLACSGGYMAAAISGDQMGTSSGEFIYEKGDFIIVADAGIYKWKELVKRMGRGGEGENGRRGEGERGGWGDAALILEAWLKWGEECVKYLYGDFAFVIFNTVTGEIFCARDPLGVRPFYYMFDQGIFIFGSELRYVLASQKILPGIRQDYLLDTLVTVKSEKHTTPFENIYRLSPGHYLNFSGGVVHVNSYWQPEPDRQIRFSSEDDYVQLFREKLVNAVKMRCKGVNRLGSELSGGLDSSAVTGIANDIAKSGNTSFTTFSNIFPSDTGLDFKDEQEFISKMLLFKPVEWTGVDRLNQTIPELLAYTIEIQGCYIQQNYSIFNRSLFEAAGGKDIQVLLSGFGGDELVSARTAIPWNELIRERQWRIIADELFYNGTTIKALLKTGLISGRYLYSFLYKPAFKTGVFTPELLGRRFANLPLQNDFATLHKLRQRLEEKFRMPRQDKLAWRQFTQIMLDHLPQRLEYCYTAAAQYGLEYRYPLLDVDLVETCLAFPPWIKQHHSMNRYLFRQAIEGFVPEEIRRRDDKSGTTIPHTYYSLVNERNNILSLVDSCSGSDFLRQIFDFSRFPQWYDKLVKRDKSDMNYLMPGAFYNYLMIMIYYGRRKT
jgi:asparagine synthase (glutamine-hydrolysing)